MEENSKLKNPTPKAKEKRPSNPQMENQTKKTNKGSGLTKTDLSQLMPPQNFDANSSVKKIFSEANKIVKIGLEKEFALQEKNNTLQSSNETIDNLRKNILHLQMEYEKLDQNYQREISNRTEIVKRMDATRDIVESMVQYSNTLASSIKLLEEDKCKIVEYYDLIYQGQKDIEEKYTEVSKFINELDNLIKSKAENLKNSYDKTLSQNSETISQLNRKLSYAADKLKISENENEKLQRKIEEITNNTRKMEASLQEQQNDVILNQNVLSKLKISCRKLKKQRFKYQKLLKIKKKKISALISRNNACRKNLEWMEDLLEKSKLENKTLEAKNHEWESKFENRILEEALQNQNWEAQLKELCDKVKLFEMEGDDLKEQNEKLNERVSELTKIEEDKQKEIEELQNDLSRIVCSNLNLQEELKKLNEEKKRKENEISDLEVKMSELGCKLNSEASFYQKEVERCRDLVKKLENQLLDAEKKISLEKNQKEIILSDCESKHENLKIANEKIHNLEKLLNDKEDRIKAVEFQQMSLSTDGKKAMEKLNKEIQAQKLKNQELNAELEKLQDSYSSVKKELQEATNKNLNFQEKLNEEKLLNDELKTAKKNIENNALLLRKEIQMDKNSIQELEEKQKKAEKELAELKKTLEENDSLKSTIAELKNMLNATEARLEAYKVVVKKLETEKAEINYNQGEGTVMLKLGSLQQEEDGMKSQVTTPQGPEKQNIKYLESLNAKIKEKISRKEESEQIETKENTQQITDSEPHQAPSTPVQDSKKFLITPRKIFTSTPQPGFRNLTPFKKKRDPYEFDSDSSVEKFDAEHVLKVFNRQKKDSNKRSKTKK